ncbi:MAG TPA: FAD-dependent monooxygenase [Stellaceae bacterium]|nr:FAD-dependent monooxygenase [Xanthobacteraceae bacterium]HUK08751.1 FAD-dependent monooxygenase [Stellaceae bacterium]
MSSRRALIIGGSISGLLAANLLRNVGWEAVVFERSVETLTGRGAGISTQPQFRDILRRIDIPFDDTMGIKVDRLICLDRRGNVVLKEPTLRIMSAWTRLYAALLARLPAEKYRLGKQFERLEQNADGVTAIFSDGTRVSGDLLVGADGLRSSVREQLLPQVQPSYAGYVAWRAMIDEAEIPENIRAELFDLYTFCLPEGEMFLGYPVPGRNNETTIGRRAYNIVWYRPADPATTLVDLCTDATGRNHGTAIPPPLIRPAVIASIKATARALIAPQAAEIFDRAQPFFQPIFDLESPQMAHGRVALLGDAAFVARPHVGTGVTKAALDAASLADGLRAAGDDVKAGLARYESEQLSFGRALVGLSRQEGAYLSAQLKPRDQRSGEELHRDDAGVVHTHNSRTEKIQRLIAGRRAGSVAVRAAQ